MSENTGLPAIRFGGCDTEWVYPDATQRDADFQRLVSNQFHPDHA